MSTISLRADSCTIPSTFKVMFEEACPTFTDPFNGNAESQVVIPLTEDTATNFNPCCDLIANTFKTIASAFSAKFFKNKAKSAIVFNLASGEFIAAAISDYDADGENYFYNISFSEEDIKDIPSERRVNFTDFEDEARSLKFWQIYNLTLSTSHPIAFRVQSLADTAVLSTFKALYKWFDVNAKDGEVVSLDITDWLGHFEPVEKQQYYNSLKTVAIGSVEVIKDKKVISIQLGEELKAIAKGNNDLSC